MYFDLINGPAQQLMQDISQRAITSRADWVKQVLELSSEWRPYGYRHGCEMLNDYYLGEQQEGLTAQLQKQFPQTWKRMPTNMVLPVLRRWIDQQATVYLTPAARTLMTAEGGDAVDDPAQLEAFEKLQRDAAYWEVWQRLDRTVHLFGAGLMLWSWNTFRNRIECNVVQPHLVHIVPDVDRPDDISAAYAVLIELATDKGVRYNQTNRRFLAYWRGVDDDGREDWQAVVVREDGTLELGALPDAMDFTAPIKDADGRTVLPMIWLQREKGHGVVYPRPPVDLLHSQDAINGAWCDINMRAQTSGYGSYVATALDTERARGALNITPGGVSVLEEGENLQSITADSRLSEHVELLQDYLLQQAQRLGLPPSSWAPKNRPQLSGVALKVENLESELARAQSINRYERLEEDDAWNIARAVWNTYAPMTGDTALDESTRMVWRPGPTTIPTDDEAQRRVLDHDVSKNWLTAAQAMARALSISEQEAEDRLAANTDTNRAQIRPAGMGLAEAALGIVGSQDPAAVTPAEPQAEQVQEVDTALEAAAVSGEDVAKSALNGAQIKSLVELVAQVSEGTLDRKSAVEIIQVSFPTVDAAQANKLVP
jgi:hypothetical protein